MIIAETVIYKNIILKNKIYFDNIKTLKGGLHMKNKMKIVIPSIIIIIQIIAIIIIMTQLNTAEKRVYEIAFENLNKFKDPSSVKVIEATTYGDNYALVKLGGTNSFGGFVSDTYYIENNDLYTYKENTHIAKEISENCFNYEKSNMNKVKKMDEKSLKKINKKIKARY